jgi:hypothetical protein
MKVASRVVRGPNKLGQLHVPQAIHRSVTQDEKVSSKEWSPLRAGGQIRRQRKTRKCVTEEGQTSYHVHFCLSPYLIPRRGTASAYGCPEIFDGYLPLIVQPLTPIPISNTGRNAELFHFCKNIKLKGRVDNDKLTVHDVLAPYIGAIDGINQSKVIRDGYRPWMVNSPMMAYTAILFSSYFQAEIRGLDVSTHAEAIAIKVEIISIINEYLGTNRGTVSDEAIAAVNHFLITEARKNSLHFVPE